MSHRVSVLLLVWVWVGLVSVQGSVPLSRQGQPVAEIVVMTSHPAVEFAAQELQRWVESISGARLPIVTEAGSAGSRVVLVVEPPGYAADLAKLSGNDGYAVRSSGQTVTLLASQPKGILHGVFKLLYRNTDIIWARPDEEFGTLYSRNPDLALTQVDYLDVPVYVLRGWQMGSGRDASLEEWQVRNSSNWSAGSMRYLSERVKYAPVLEYGGGHNLVGRYIPEKKYYDAHPEYYPLRGGKRLRPSETRASTQLCFTLPELQQVFIEEVDARVRENPDYDTYRIMIEDNWNLCECETCLAPIRLADGRVIDQEDKSFRSTQFFLWLNPIAKHLHDTYGKRVLTFGYFFTEPPPHCPIEPNISISFCPIGKNSKRTLTEPENASSLEKFTGWLKVTNQLTWREYYGLCYSFPRPIDVVAMADWRYVNGHGINRTYSEMRPDIASNPQGVKSWHVNAMYFWVMANGSWNPYQDVAAMRNDFLARVFGPAAADVAEFYRLIEEQWFKLDGSSRWNDKAYVNWKKHVFDTGITADCQAALTRAAAKVVHPHAARMLSGMQEVLSEHLELLDKENVHASPTTVKPSFDPDFAGGAWQQAVPNSHFLLNRSGELFRQATTVRALYDEENIYFGFKCEHDQPAQMPVAAANDGKNEYPQGESFEIFLEGEWRGERHFTQMVVNPVGNRYGAVRPATWTSEAARTETGWSGMITVSWKSLGLAPAAVDALKASFFRQFMISPKPGTAPPQNAHLPGGRRHSLNTTTRVVFKKP
jgi:hypothetical protein